MKLIILLFSSFLEQLSLVRDLGHWFYVIYEWMNSW